MMDSISPTGRVALVALVALVTSQGCASNAGRWADEPEPRLEYLLREWQSVRDEGDSCASGGRLHPYVDCGRIQAAIERMVLDFPNHRQVLMANAVVAYETDQPEKAMDYLDTLIEFGDAQPEAAVLRSRIAIQQGNLPYAERLLDRFAQLHPADPTLRESRASLYYLQGSHAAARRELTVAQRLGAPAWRISYNRGLIEEASGNPDIAILHYRDALASKPDWPEAQSRLRGLESQQGL